MNALVAQSGGPTAVINGSVFGILEGAIMTEGIDKVYGGINGIEGIMSGQIIDLTEWDGKKRTTFLYSPSSGLGSCRYKLPDINRDGPDLDGLEVMNQEYHRIFTILEDYEIACFFYIGGNDSMDTIYKLSEYGRWIGSPIRFIGIPKTVDNDLYGTDHCPGYGSAAKYIIRSIMEMAHDANVYPQKSVHIVEVMGRHAGWLAAATVMARYGTKRAVDLIYLPELPFSLSRFLHDVEVKLKRKSHVIVVVSEGLRKSNGEFVASEEGHESDRFGYRKMGGVATYLAQELKVSFHQSKSQVNGLDQSLSSCKVVAVELGILQRGSIYHASRTDLYEAVNCGYHGLLFALQGISGQMVVMDREPDQPYHIHYRHIPIEEAAGKEKTVPRELINQRGNHMKENFLDYIRPLIQGNVEIPEKEGLPLFIGDEALNNHYVYK